MTSRRAEELQRELKNYEITPRPVFALLALLAVQIGTLIHREVRGGRQETPSILDMDLPNCRDAANIAWMIICHNLCGSFLCALKQQTSSCHRHDT